MRRSLEPQFPVGRRPFAIACGTLFGLPVLAAVAAVALQRITHHPADACGSLPAGAWSVVLPLTGLAAFAGNWAMWERTSVSRVLVSLGMTAVTLVFAVIAGLIGLYLTLSGVCGN